MKKLLAFISIVTFMGMLYAARCVHTKQCCKTDYLGNVQCVTVCSFDICPVGYYD